MLMEPKYHSHCSDWAVGLMTWGPNPNSDKIFLFSRMSKPDLEPVQHPASCLKGAGFFLWGEAAGA